MFLCPEYVPPAKPKTEPLLDPLKDLKFSPSFDLTTPPVPLLDSPRTTHKQISSQVSLLLLIVGRFFFRFVIRT